MSPENKEEVKIYVSPKTQPWPAAVQLNKGDYIRITATGTYHHGDDTKDWGPGGDKEGKAEDFQKDKLFFPKKTPFALQAKIGDGEPFEVVTEILNLVTSNGNLMFAVNDWKNDGDVDHYANNVGELTVTVNITRASKAFLISPPHEFKQGEKLYASGNRFFLVWQPDGNLVVRNANSYVWGLDFTMSGWSGYKIKKMVFENSGSLVAYDASGTTKLWTSDTNGENAQLNLDPDTGRLYITTTTMTKTLYEPKPKP